jgi:molybdopterin synthase sulfur carrier subunit
MPLVKLFGNLRQYAGAKHLDLPGTTVREVLEALCADSGTLRDAVFQVGGTLRPHVRVVVNGRDSELGQGLDTALDETDEIAIFPPIAGGTR